MKKLIFTLAIAMMVCSSGNLFAQSSDRMSEVRAFAQQRYQHAERGVYEPVSANYFDFDKEYRSNYSYDEDDLRLHEEITQMKDANGWVNQQMNTYEYDEMGRTSSTLIQVWGNNVWVNSSKLDYVYDEDVIHIMDSAWVDGELKACYNYTIIDTPESYEMIQQEFQEDGTLKNVYKKIISYNADHHIASIIYQIWDEAANAFQNSTLQSYIYEGPLCKTIYYSDWENGDWTEPDGKFEFTCDDCGNTTQAIAYSFYDGQWNEGDLCADVTIPYAYNEKNKLFIASKVDIVYSDITLSTNEMTQNTAFNLYPNPANGMISVNGEGFEKAEIYNIAGQKVMESSNAQIDVEALQAGVYMVKVFGNGSSEMLRVVVK